MPVHDWSQVDAATFHAMHTLWIAQLSTALNEGVLPSGYYALPEQHMSRLIGDVLTLQGPPAAFLPALPAVDGVGVAEAPPRVRRKVSLSGNQGPRRTVTIRHASGHRIIALLEIVSPANKDRPAHVESFIDKAEYALMRGINLLVLDLLPPGLHDPRGMHGALAQRFLDDDDEPYVLPPGEPLTLASYVAGPWTEAYLEPLAVGAILADMPLFLNADHYVNVPLESTYQAAFRGLPAFLRELLERRSTASSAAL